MSAVQASVPSPEAECRFVPPHALRALAWLIDFLIVALVLAFAPAGNHFAAFSVLVFIAYHTVLVWKMQQTPGKALLGLRVERVGGKPRFLWSLGRASVGYFGIDLLGIGILAALLNQDHRCFHDYIFGSRVVFEGQASVKLRNLLGRLCEFAEKQKKTEKAKTIAILWGFWSFLQQLASWVRKALDWLTGTAKTAPAHVHLMSLKLAVGISTVATTVSAAGAVYAPPVRQAADWLLTPKVSGQPPHGWGLCSCPGSHPYIGVIYNGRRWHGPGYDCPPR